MSFPSSVSKGGASAHHGGSVGQFPGGRMGGMGLYQTGDENVSRGT